MFLNIMLPMSEVPYSLLQILQPFKLLWLKVADGVGGGGQNGGKGWDAGGCE